MSEALQKLRAAVARARPAAPAGPEADDVESLTTGSVERRIQAAADKHGIKVSVEASGDVLLRHRPERSLGEAHRLAKTLPHLRVIDTFRDGWKRLVTRAIAHQDHEPRALDEGTAAHPRSGAAASERVLTFTPAPVYHMRPAGPWRYYVVDQGDGTVRLREPGGRFGPVMPHASVRHFVDDLTGVVRPVDPLTGVPIGPSGIREIDAVLGGRAELLGKGQDGLAFRVGASVVKVSTTVPFQPENSGHVSPEMAIERMRRQTEMQNRLADLGIPCVPRVRFVVLGDKGFQTKPWVAIPETWTRAQLDALQDCLIAMHRAGYSMADAMQAGLASASEQPTFFDLGQAQPIPPDDATRGRWSAVEADMEHMHRLYQEAGLVFVRRDQDEALAKWHALKERSADWELTPSGRAYARRAFAEGADLRRRHAQATLSGEALARALERIDDDEAWELEKFPE